MVMSFFRRSEDSGIDHIEAQVQRMVTDARHTFDLAMNAITGGSVASVGEEVRRTDRRINVTEMEIRRELVLRSVALQFHTMIWPSREHDANLFSGSHTTSDTLRASLS